VKNVRPERLTFGGIFGDLGVTYWGNFKEYIILEKHIVGKGRLKWISNVLTLP
jgi:hypothetical protein